MLELVSLAGTTAIARPDSAIRRATSAMMLVRATKTVAEDHSSRARTIDVSQQTARPTPIAVREPYVLGSRYVVAGAAQRTETVVRDYSASSDTVM